MKALDTLEPGRQIPDDLNVIIEIAAHNDPVKYEIDNDTRLLHVDRFMGTSMRYPCNYGFIPKTLGLDGDPLDILTITPFPLMPGCVIRCRPIGILKMVDEAGSDDKILTVPIDKVTPIYQKIQSHNDLPKILLDSISHFFVHYKDLDSNKWAKVTGWEDHKAAQEAIIASIKRYKA